YSMPPRAPPSSLFPYTTLFRSRVVLEAEHAAVVEQAVFCGHHRRKVFVRDRTVVKDGVAREALRIGMREAAQVAYKQIKSMCVYLDAISRISSPVLGDDAVDDRAPLRSIRQAKIEARRARLQLGRYLDRVADQKQHGTRP